MSTERGGGDDDDDDDDDDDAVAMDLDAVDAATGADVTARDARDGDGDGGAVAGEDGAADAKEEAEKDDESDDESDDDDDDVNGAMTRPGIRVGAFTFDSDVHMDERGRYVPRWTTMEMCPEKSTRAKKFGTIKDDNWVRPSLEECSIEDFMFDFMRFHHKQGRDWEIVWSAMDRVMIRTGKPMDCLHFYKQVCALGGFISRAHAKQSFRIMSIFEQMFNYYDNHTLTDIGNRCLTAYEDFFLEYEDEHPEDKAFGKCSLCRGGSYQGTNQVNGLLHVCITCERLYHKCCQPPHRFASCCNKGCFAGVPMAFVCNKCLTTPGEEVEMTKIDEQMRMRHWEDSGTYYVRLFELVARRGRRYNASYVPPTRAVETVETREAWQAGDAWNTS